MQQACSLSGQILRRRDLGSRCVGCQLSTHLGCRIMARGCQWILLGKSKAAVVLLVPVPGAAESTSLAGRSCCAGRVAADEGSAAAGLLARSDVPAAAAEAAPRGARQAAP